jgi:metal-responsive CopG/Arc/MetJ family transcriptional regulator
MTTAKVAISLEAALLARVDEKAAKLGVSRSALIRQCVSYALGSLDEERTIREAREIYAAIEGSSEAARLHDAFSGLSYSTLPPFDAAKR